MHKRGSEIADLQVWSNSSVVTRGGLVREVHGNNPVTHLSCSTRVVLSLGFDLSMRLIDVESKDVLTGGKLTKRLEGNEFLSALTECTLAAWW